MSTQHIEQLLATLKYAVEDKICDCECRVTSLTLEKGDWFAREAALESKIAALEAETSALKKKMLEIGGSL
jgi:hypothetical protein